MLGIRSTRAPPRDFMPDSGIVLRNDYRWPVTTLPAHWESSRPRHRPRPWPTSTGGAEIPSGVDKIVAAASVGLGWPRHAVGTVGWAESSLEMCPRAWLEGVREGVVAAHVMFPWSRWGWRRRDTASCNRPAVIYGNDLRSINFHNDRGAALGEDKQQQVPNHPAPSPALQSTASTWSES